jgi:hypothetical protein
MSANVKLFAGTKDFPGMSTTMEEHSLKWARRLVNEAANRLANEGCGLEIIKICFFLNWK